MRSPGKSAFVASFAVLVAAAPLLAQGAQGKAAPHVADRTFLLGAASAGLEQVRLGRLALLKAANADVKSLAQQLVDGHSKINDQLRQLAASKGLGGIQAHPDRSTQRVYDQFDKLSGDDFDVAYVQRLVEDHLHEVAEFANAAQRAADADVRQFAASALPSLQDDLKTAKALESEIAGRASRHLGPGTKGR